MVVVAQAPDLKNDSEYIRIGGFTFTYRSTVSFTLTATKDPHNSKTYHTSSLFVPATAPRAIAIGTSYKIALARAPEQ